MKNSIFSGLVIWFITALYIYTHWWNSKTKLLDFFGLWYYFVGVIVPIIFYIIGAIIIVASINWPEED